MNAPLVKQGPVVQGSIGTGTRPGWAGAELAQCVRSADGGRFTCMGPDIALAWGTRGTAHCARGGRLVVLWGSAATPEAAERALDVLATAGVRGMPRVGGPFALFFVDAASATFVLAVDRFSIETACFASERESLRFSDRADGVPVSARTLSLQAIHDYVYFHCIPAPCTIFSEVTRLERAQYVAHENGRVEHGVHWRPRFEPSQVSLAARKREFVALVRDAVAREAGRDDRLGCFLSGGTDSSTIVGMLARVAGVPPRTYSIGFDADGYDEMAYARVAARRFATDQHEYYVTPADVVRGIPEVASYADQPFGNSSVVPALFCARLAAADGVTRMLAGDGGDELFGGNSRYAMQKLLALYDAVPSSVRRRAIEPVLGTRLGRLPGIRRIAGFVRHARPPMPDRMQTHNLLTAMGAARILHRAVLDAVDPTAPLALQRRVYDDTGPASLVDRMLCFDWTFTLADSDLPKVRTATSIAGLSVGYPLLSDALADFALTLPASYKLRGLRLRWFFKEALRDLLPAEIIRKQKHGFGLPFGRWALSHRPLRDLAGDSLAGLDRRGIIAPGLRDELLGALLPAHPGYYGELLWILMMLEQWLCRHGTQSGLAGHDAPRRPEDAGLQTALHR